MQEECWSRLPPKPVPHSVLSTAIEFTEVLHTFMSFILEATVFSVKTMEQIRSPQAAFFPRLRDWQAMTNQYFKQETYFILANTSNILQIGQEVLFILLSCCWDNAKLDYESFD
jgi:hypothetical protein